MAAAQAASLGLEIDGVLGHAYIVPFKGEATLIPGYLGLKELAYRSSRISSVVMQEVFQGDEFEFELGTSPWIKHRPTDAASVSTVTHVYAIVNTTTAGVIPKVMSWAQVENHRNKFSKGYTRADSSWQTNPVAMGLKTVLRKAMKLAPLSPEIQRLLQQDEYAEQLPSFPSGTEAPVEDLDAAAELLDAPQIPMIGNAAAPMPEELADPSYNQHSIPF